MRLSDTLKYWIPPIMEKHLKQLLGRGIYFKGEFPDWMTAAANSTGYDAGLILEKVKQARSKVKTGEATYERDSVLFDHVQHSFPVLAALLRAAAENANRLAILDFGGSLGSSYFQCRAFLSVLDNVDWGIVEQPHFVGCGREYFEEEQLRFFEDIASCDEHIHPNLALLSSVLQYVQEPFEVLDELMQRGLPYIVIDRTPFSDRLGDCIAVQHVPARIYRASYPCWIFSRPNFLARTHSNYEIIAEFESNDGQATSGSMHFTFGGMILRKRV